jgi:hypothetical protein
MSGTVSTDDKKKRQRSPNYPALGLEEAIAAVTKLHEKDRCHAVPASIVHERWGYKAHSSVATQSEAALKAYGLLAAQGEALDRKVSVTSKADRIIRNAPDRDAMVQEAALQPRIFAELWKRYESEGLPTDEVIQSYLVWERKDGQFTQDAAKEVVKRFRSTIEFAKLSPGGKIDWAPQYSGALGSSGDLLPEAGWAGKTATPKDDPKSRMVRAKPMGGTREEVFDVPEGGQVILQFPATMTPDTFVDFKDWLQIAIRKIGRLVREPNQTATHQSED